MDILHKAYLTPVTLILDLVDSYAKSCQVRGPHPRPIGYLEFHVIAQKKSGERAEFPKPLPLKILKNSSGFFLFFRKVEMLSSKFHQILEPGSYVIRVRSPQHFYQDIVVDNVSIPSKPNETPLVRLNALPGFAYPFPTSSNLTQGKGSTILRGSILHRDGLGIAGVAVNADDATNPYTTDETGQWVLVFSDDHPSGAVTVNIEYPDGTVELVTNVLVEQGFEKGLLSTAFRGRVINETGVGIPDVAIEVNGIPGQSKTDSQGGWFYYFNLTQPEAMVEISVSLPSGISQTVEQQAKPHATLMIPTFQFN